MLESVTSPVLESNTQAFIDQVVAGGGPPLYTLSPAEARKVVSSVQAGAKNLLPVDIEKKTIPVGPTGETRILIVRPQGNTQKLPVLMFFHGAGWVLGGWDTHERLVRDLVVGANVAAVFVDFDLSPEAKYPTAIEQDYAATKYVAEHGDELNLDSSRMACAGDSVGGNQVIAVTMLAKQRGGPKIDLQVLFYPVTDANFDNGSYKQFANGPWLTREAMKWFWNSYLPDEGARKQPTVTPLNTATEELKGLPPALIMTAENDVLRDEGEAYGHKLMQAGVKVTSVRFLGTIHDFAMLNAISDAPACRGAVELAVEKIRLALDKR